MFRCSRTVVGAALVFWTGVAAVCRAAEPARDASTTRDVQRALGLLEYVAGDYNTAVGPNGTLRDPEEYGEQAGFMQEATAALTAAAGDRFPALLDELRALRAECEERRPGTQVIPHFRTLQAHVAAAFRLDIAPRQVPSIAVGRLLYTQACAVCHGADGSARTPAARRLHPRPGDFRARGMESRLSPYAVFAAMTFGVSGTGMASFELLEETERWDVAFYVCALRHAPPGAPPAGAAAPGMVSHDPAALTLKEAALGTDADLLRRLRGRPAAAQAEQLARWRWSPPLDVGR
jgi:mono/diheme cytochrome c family protein